MFTGIISEIGKVRGITRKGDNILLEVGCGRMREGLAIGDSVAVNGVCLSVVSAGSSVVFDVVGNTFKESGLKGLSKGDPVNLENAMISGGKISGHIVTGHVDGVRAVRNNMPTSRGQAIDIAMDKGDEEYMVRKGSVALDGVSLTIGEIYGVFFRVYLIPLTLSGTILRYKKKGDYVNIEFDIMGKYARKNRSGTITEETLRNMGFM